MAKPLKFTTYQREAKIDPLPLELPDGVTVIIPVPDGEKIMEIEEAGSTRKTLRLLFGSEQWEQVQPLISTITDPGALRELVMDIMAAFNMGSGDRPPADGPR